MAERTFRVPDIGEGIAEAELTEWMVKVGALVREDDVICEITSDKVTVEIPAAVSGRISWLGANAGDTVAVGSDLVRIETDAEAPEARDVAPPEKGPESPDEPRDEQRREPPDEPRGDTAPDTLEPAPGHPVDAAPQTAARPSAAGRRPRGAESPGLVTGAGGKPLAAPSVRGRAREMGIDLRRVRGTGPAGRILHEDLEDFQATGGQPARSSVLAPREGTEEIRVTGVRRAIAERMALSKSRIPHFSIVEEVEVEALEELREGLNTRFADRRGKLTLLPFLMRALAEAVRDHPEINAHFDDDAGIITRHAALHCGIATQTAQGLMVPVVRHAEAMTLWEAAQELRRLSDAARDRRAAAKDLSGSTLTITSLGPLGAVATTPIINHPEVAIVGINRMMIRPVWSGTEFVPRRMMNLSCSFDHRVVDGWAAAQFVAKLKQLLEMPAMLFMEWRDD